MNSVDDPPTTGNEIVDEALAKVAGLAETPLDEHPQILKQAQNTLQEFLSSTSGE